MRKLLIYLKNYKKECILAPLFKMLEASFELFVPLVVAAMIDKGMAYGDKPYIIKSCGLLVVLAFVGLVSAVTAQYYSAKAAVGFSTALRKDLFAHLMHLSFAEYDELGSSTMITRMTSDVMQAQTGVNMFLRLTLRSPFVVVGAMIMAFTVDAKASIIFAVVIMLLSLVVGGLMSYNIPLLVKVQSKLDKILLLTRENLNGVRVLRAFGRRNQELEDYSRSNQDLYHSQIVAASVSSIMNPVTYMIINLAIVCLIYVGAIRVNIGHLSQGSVVALYNYMSQILVELIKLANMIVTLNKAIASGDRIASVLELEDSQISDNNNKKYYIDPSAEIAVEFQNVSFKYNQGGDDSLSNISFLAEKGQIIGIIGGTGAGKSTLVNLIARYYDANDGIVSVFGADVRKYEMRDLRNNIGFVFQKSALFSGTIADNLKYAKADATEEEMLEAMHLAVADDVLEAKGGLYEQVGEAGKELSGGQKQRLTIARALIKKPPILIFDDSASALDFATSAQLVNNIKKLKYNPTVFFVSQRANIMLDADSIIVLEDGLVRGIGKHDYLLKSCDTYREIYNTQFGDANARKEMQ